MSSKKIADLIQPETKQPVPTVEETSAITTTQAPQIAELAPTSQSLFEESKAIWDEFVAFDREHHLTQRVGAQLWRLTRAAGKPLLVLSLRGIQAAVVTAVDPEKRTALIERFSHSPSAIEAEASLGPVED